jgi:hypothetical protein
MADFNQYPHAMETDTVTGKPMQKISTQITDSTGKKAVITTSGALTVAIDGASGTGGSLGVNIKQTEIIQPMDHQATLVNTAVTHTSAVVTPSGSSAQATWVAVPEGMSEFINNLTIDGAIANCYTSVSWSEDGTTTSGATLVTVSNTVANASKTSPNWLAIGGTFYKVSIVNGDTAPHTCSANIKFRP